ncbi:MAG: type II toxin-antitoxin system RelE/ParE family toxin [Candidatus Omnitrophica bacterium]|nr:type II toxin-antitoxin system RelE/ParE family toxin [Candidatus Omnitrophota bacterium]
MKWRLVVTPEVETALRSYPPEIKRYIRAALDEIRKDPWIGKSLRDELAGFHSFRARRFRIVYRIERTTITVVVIGIGSRKTIYEKITAEVRSRK